MPLDPASIEGARPDHDISRIPLCNVVQPLEFVDGSREIRVGEQDMYVPIASSTPVRTLYPLPQL